MAVIFLTLISLLILVHSDAFSITSPLRQRQPRLPHFNIEQKSSVSKSVELRGAALDDMLKDAFEWNANLGAPAALVGGAVIANFLDRREDLTAKKDDARWVKRLKRACRFLLLSSFALEVACIFVTTVTGTMLLTYGDGLEVKALDVTCKSALGFLHKNFEFEYLTARITFIQGLMHWLFAVLFETLIPGEDETKSTRRVNQFLGSIMTTLILILLGFYNKQMSFYENYGSMLLKYARLIWKRHFWYWPWRPMTYLIFPSLLGNIYLARRAMKSVDEEG